MLEIISLNDGCVYWVMKLLRRNEGVFGMLLHPHFFVALL